MEEAVEICKLRLFLKLVAQVEEAKKIEPLPDIDFNIRAGNTLVGFARLDDVKNAMTSQLFSGDALKRIEDKAIEVESLFGLFRQMQTEQGMDSHDFADTKEEVGKQLKALEEELNGYLAGQYGVNPKKQKEYERWLASHKPFHWFVEFYGILKDGGFDVIIGNPPYVELTVLKGYSPLRYTCQACGNLYAFVMERAETLCNGHSRRGFIVPVSSISTDRYSELQRLIAKQKPIYSSFDDRPSRLFEGLEHVRLSIHLLNGASATPELFSTKYNKWTAAERPILFDNLSYARVVDSPTPGTLAKLSNEIEADIFKKMLADRKPLQLFYSPVGQNYVLYSRKIGYFLQVLNFQPRVIDAHGNVRPPSEFKELRFSHKPEADTVLCALNSSLFYWYVTVFSDCRHVNKREIDNFPINLANVLEHGLGEEFVSLAKTLMTALSDSSEEKTMSFQHDRLTIQCIFPKRSKPIIDEIDRVLAKHYGFTDEELDFIINYDIKYRMGLTGESDDDE